MVQTLPVPAPVEADPNSGELIRVFVANNAAHVIFNPSAFAETEMWGILMSDVMRHLVRGLAQSTGKNPTEVGKILMEAFSHGLTMVSAETKGGLQKADA